VLAAPQAEYCGTVASCDTGCGLGHKLGGHLSGLKCKLSGMGCGFKNMCSGFGCKLNGHLSGLKCKLSGLGHGLKCGGGCAAVETCGTCPTPQCDVPSGQYIGGGEIPSGQIVTPAAQYPTGQ
jgi:hypothetical protein